MREFANQRKQPCFRRVFGCDLSDGWAMSQPLPLCGFRFLQPDEIEALGDAEELSDDVENGCIFEVDLSYPQHLHDAHDDYPLAPESLEIDRDIYSPAQQAVCPQTASQRKLTVLTFEQSTWLKTYIDSLWFTC